MKEGVTMRSRNTTTYPWTRGLTRMTAGFTSRHTTILLTIILIAMGGLAPAVAQQEEPKLQRTIFVPFDDLSGILGGENERVFMTRDAYRLLQAEAAKQPPKKAPVPVVLLSAAYETTIKDSTAIITGRMELEVLEAGLHAVEMPFESVALRTAMLDGATAPLARNEQGKVVLFVRDTGRHQLELEFHTPVVVAAAQQSLQFRLPDAGSTTLRVAVPGNVEVKSGASVVQRVYDQASDQTRIELAFTNGTISLVMSLNNRRLREDRVVLARTVLVSELTTSYERLHATVDMHVLHGAVDRFLFDVPAGFQITSVSSPLMSQWVIRQEEGRRSVGGHAARTDTRHRSHQCLGHAYSRRDRRRGPCPN